MLTTLFWMAVLAALVVLALTAILNTLTFPRLGRLGRATTPADLPPVAICIPARNEAAVIADTVRTLLAQTHPRFHLLILDDASTDTTAALAHAAATNDPRLTVLAGQPLPPGWLGKNWACHQLAQHALRLDPAPALLIFTDADVQWRPTALADLLAAQHTHRADMLTVWPTQLTGTFAERAVVPLMDMVISAYLPEIMVRLSPFPAFAAANGQCLAFTPAAYAATGGHAAVRDNIVEDVALARRTKQAGRKLVMTRGNDRIACRMYTNWPTVRDGFAKNILAGHGNSLPFLAFSTVFHLSLFIAPWLWLLTGALIDTGPRWPACPLTLIALGLLIRTLSAAATQQRLRDALTLPLGVLLMTRIALRAAEWRLRHGGPQWKGRTVPTPRP